MNGLPGMLGLRPLLCLAASVMVTGLAGCAPQHDNDPNGFTVVNQSDVPMTVVLVRLPLPEHQFTVEPRARVLLPTDRCIDADIVVRTAAAEVADLAGPACPASVLRVVDLETAVIESMFG